MRLVFTLKHNPTSERWHSVSVPITDRELANLSPEQLSAEFAVPALAHLKAFYASVPAEAKNEPEPPDLQAAEFAEFLGNNG